MVVRACQPQAAWTLKTQVLLIHSSVFLPPCQSLPSFGQPLLPLTAPTLNLILFTYQMLEHTQFFKLLCTFKSCLLLLLFWRLILLIWEGNSVVALRSPFPWLLLLSSYFSVPARWAISFSLCIDSLDDMKMFPAEIWVLQAGPLSIVLGPQHPP